MIDSLCQIDSLRLSWRRLSVGTVALYLTLGAGEGGAGQQFAGFRFRFDRVRPGGRCFAASRAETGTGVTYL